MATFTKEDFKSINSTVKSLGDNTILSPEEQYKTHGFAVPAAFSADGNGLPYSKVKTGRETRLKRNIITWFVPEFGLVRMYVNPSAITYSDSKLINKERTKGGFSVQYWGEDMSSLQIQGTTGSSGIEGINMLQEVYRAEQLAFDSIGLSLAASNAATDLATKGIETLGGAIGGATGAFVGGALAGLLGTDSPNANSLGSKNIMTLSQLACSVEMYYNGWVFRGYFENMTVNERADNFLFEYTINFKVFQRRGYRVNYFPWNRSPGQPSEYNSPLSSDPFKVSSPGTPPPPPPPAPTR